MYAILLKKSILIAEDDIISNDNLKYMLQKYFKKVVSCYSGDEAYKQYLIHKPDVILTDIEMPTINGLKLIEKIRKSDTNSPIIIMTSFTHQHYLLQALNLQLLSYITKPITRKVFNKFLETLEKLFLSKNSKLFFFTSKAYYNYAQKIIVNDKKTISLTHQEISLIEEFIQNKNRILSNEFIENILDMEYSKNSNAVKLTISRLRKKLPINCIKTVYKEGYRLDYETK